MAGNIKIGEPEDENLIIENVDDFVDLLGNAGYYECPAIILDEKNLHPDFFRLHTGLAGEILQKVSNYSQRLAITGDFSKFTSKSLADFIRESNRGNRVFFVSGRQEAIDAIVKLANRGRLL